MWHFPFFRIMVLALIVFISIGGLVSTSPVEAQSTTNLLVDPSFEGPIWVPVSIDQFDTRVSFNVPAGWWGAVYLTPHTENWMNAHPSGFPHTAWIKRSGFKSLHVARGFATFTAVVYQQVSVQRNSPLEGGTWAYMDTDKGLMRVGIDPNGGTNPFDADVVWSNWVAGKNVWSTASVSTRATGTVATLFLFATQNQPSDPNGVYWDDAYLNGIPGTGLVPTAPTQPTAPSTPSGNLLTSTVRLNVRTGAGLNFSRIGTIQPGTQYTYTGESNGWYSIDYNGQTGWVFGRFVQILSGQPTPSTPTSPVAPDSAASGTITSGNAELNVRTGPGTNYAVIGRIYPGQQYRVTGKSGDWYAIDFNGTIGYISARYARFVN